MTDKYNTGGKGALAPTIKTNKKEKMMIKFEVGKEYFTESFGTSKVVEITKQTEKSVWYRFIYPDGTCSEIYRAKKNVCDNEEYFVNRYDNEISAKNVYTFEMAVKDTENREKIIDKEIVKILAQCLKHAELAYGLKPVEFNAKGQIVQ